MKTFDDLLRSIGDFGTYQKRLFFLCVLPSAFNACFTLVTVFILYDHQHRCQHSTNGITFNTTEVNTTLFSHPQEREGKITQCYTLSFNETLNVTSEEKCTSWIYDSVEQTRTPISDFDLVCDRVVLRSHANMAYFGGTFLGVFLAGMLGDLIGRKPVFTIGIVFLTFGNLACVWSYNYYMFLVTRILSGMASAMAFAAALVIPMEIVGLSRRVFVGIIPELIWCVGEVILCGLAYFIRNWRTLQLVMSAPSAILLIYIFIIPESPRWLLLVGKKKQAKRIIRKIAKVNGRACTEEALELSDMNVTGSLKDVIPFFSSPKLLIRWIIVSFTWFTISMSYYGLILNAGRIGGNIYLNFLVSAIVEALGYSSCLFINDRYGRKVMNCCGLVLAGVSCLATIFPTLYADDSLMWITIVLSMIGKFGVSAAFGNIYIYTSELFPTSIRSFTLASSNIFARVGSLVSPYIADLSVLVDSMFGKALPLIIFGVLGLTAGILSFALPETLNTNLPDKLQDIMTNNEPKRGRTRKREDVDVEDRMPLRSLS